MNIGDAPRKPVPLADPGADTQEYRDAIITALARVVNGGNFILGPEVNRFERSMAASLDVSDVVGVASGTDALVLAQLALGIGAGDEVIAPSHTAGPTIAAIHMSRATPVLVECDPDTYCIDAGAVAAAVSSRTKAIIAVHLYGHPANIDALQMVAPGIPIIEDCAQAQGARLNGRAIGGLGAISCFSFYPTKNLGALGDGGAVATNDAQLALTVRRLRAYGWTHPQYAELENGRCSRLDEMQAAILSVKLEALPDAITRRRSIAARYRNGMKDLPLILPREAPGAVHAYHLFVLRSDRRDALEKHLQAAGIGTGRHYPYPTHVQPGLASKARIPGSLARTETLYGEILSLPMFATMSDEQTDNVIAAVRSFFA
jgi:dTDP-4-amino-4,6-dideoxygalactose transaminase